LETLGENTNHYDKMANISYDKASDVFDYATAYYNSGADVYAYCDQAKSLFELYKRCLGRNQIENIIAHYIASMDAIKVSRGHLYFVPKSHMHGVDALEDFVAEVCEHNRYNGQDTENIGITINAMFVVDDAKQREKMAAEFYANVKKDIESYQERVENLIATDSKSCSVMDRWVNKIAALADKKRNYESILKRELDALDDEFSALKFLSQELQLRARRLQLQKCA
jgi:hypothetical protein